MDENTTKVCSHCGRELPLSEFHKKSKAPDGHQSWCKECTNKAVSSNRTPKTSRGLARYSDAQLLAALKGRSRKVLVDPTPRELMENLAALGYKGKLEYTETHIIDINNF